MTTIRNPVRFTAPDEGERVSVRVLPLGAGCIYTGEDDVTANPAARFSTYERGAVFLAELAIAAELEARGLVEIQP